MLVWTYPSQEDAPPPRKSKLAIRWEEMGSLEIQWIPECRRGTCLVLILLFIISS